MEIVRSKKGEAQVLEKVKAWLQKRPRSDKGWHVSDLLYPRKAFWQRKDPQPMTDEQAGYFVAGHGHHFVVEAILGPRDKKGNRTDAGEFEKHGILFSPDLRLPYPLEFKTSRRQKAPDDSGEKLEKAYDSYLKQLTKYMALMGCKRGVLLVFYLAKLIGVGRISRPAFRFYNVYLEPHELKRIVKETIELAKLLTEAVKKKNHKKLPICPGWMCKPLDDYGNGCVWYKKCDPVKTNPNR